MGRAVTEKEIIIYADEAGVEPFTDWLDALKDKQACQRIQTRLFRLSKAITVIISRYRTGFLSCA